SLYYRQNIITSCSFLTPPPPAPPTFPYTTLFRSFDLGITGVELPQRLHQHADHGPVAVPLAVGGHDVPRRRFGRGTGQRLGVGLDRKSTRLNSSHQIISYAVFCLKKKNISAVRMG